MGCQAQLYGLSKRLFASPCWRPTVTSAPHWNYRWHRRCGTGCRCRGGTGFTCDGTHIEADRPLHVAPNDAVDTVFPRRREAGDLQSVEVWLFPDLIPDNTTDGSAADRAQRTAAREDSTRDAANPGANSSVGVPVGHAATSEHDICHDRHSHPDGDGTNLSHFSTPFLPLYADAAIRSR